MGSNLLPVLSPNAEARSDAKAFGAYYTQEAVARFLVRWAVRSSTDAVLDPSSGGGIFLATAADRLTKLGRRRESQVFGVELEPTTHAETSVRIEGRFGISAKHMICRDFFAIDPAEMPRMNAVVGNPPFIRYQRFTGSDREQAIKRAAVQGVKLPRLASSWAAFVVHSTAFLAEGGRLAMVLPMELGHASYARPILAFLAQNFYRLQLITFQRSLFPQLSEDTVLLLAEDRRRSDGRLADARLYDLEGPEALDTFFPARNTGVDLTGFFRGNHRLTEFFLPENIRELYARLQAVGVARPVGEFADIGIGYVSGRNDFFHPSSDVLKVHKLPPRYLRRAALNGGALRGLEFTEADWSEAFAKRHSGNLLYLPAEGVLPDSVAGYLELGRAQKVHEAYKCRVRKSWYAVPHVYVADGFLTYMNGAQTRLVANAASAVAPNTLHLVRLHPKSKLGIYDLASRWLSSLTQMSAEIEGHAMGGGMLKLEPREAESVIVPCGQRAEPLRPETATEFDVRLRHGEFAKARELADELYLRAELGLSAKECAALQVAALTLRNRRTQRKRSALP
ncbi:HsdM family class I SAM-dependent methyltransferase [Horticoccus sp. 23ND18S-11]|uniref:HsdM family class I SAM-dependent methyltransferase n=1 Tax=Horticoccus sp. 23ND18S-11 TaxID=3391832 RepID=UPI0039C8EE9E